MLNKKLFAALVNAGLPYKLYYWSHNHCCFCRYWWVAPWHLDSGIWFHVLAKITDLLCTKCNCKCKYYTFWVYKLTLTINTTLCSEEQTYVKKIVLTLTGQYNHCTSKILLKNSARNFWIFTYMYTCFKVHKK